MALATPNRWVAGGATEDAEAPTNPTPGNWLIAIVAWRVTDGSNPSMSVTDTPRNIWTLLYDATTSAHAAHASAQMQVQVWACPSVYYAGWDLDVVHAAAMQMTTNDLGSVILHVQEVSGFVNGHLTVDDVAIGTANAATSFTLPAVVPSVNCFVLGAAAVDNDISSVTITPTGAGFTALTVFSTVVGETPKLAESGQWKAASTSQTASWTSSIAVNWAGVAVAIRETGLAPTQPNANWPVPRFGVGLGHDMNTPLSAVRFTDQTTRLVDTDGTIVFGTERGIPQELGTALSSPTDLAIRNDDGAYTPRTVNTAASASANGTTTTIKILDANAANIHAGDFFQLKASSLALKEFTVFQVVSLASVAGTTTVTFARADGQAGGAAGATATGDVYAGIAMDLNIPWRYDLWWNNKWWPLAAGWFGDLGQSFHNAWWGQVPAVGYDALATLTAADRSRLSGEILRRRPLYYWPLSDASGATGAVDASGNGGPPLVQATSKYGAGSGTADFGASTQQIDVTETGSSVPSFKPSLLGDTGSGWAVAGLLRADMTASNAKGFALLGKELRTPGNSTGIDISLGVTIIGVTFLKSQTSGTNDTTEILNSTVDPTICIVKNTDPAAGVGQGAVFRLNAVHSGADFLKPQVTVWDKDTHLTTTTLGGVFQAFGGEFRMWAVTFDRTSWKCFNTQSGFITGSCDLVSTFSQISIGGEADQFYNGRSCGMTHAHIAVFNRILTNDEIIGLANAVKDGRPGTLLTNSGKVTAKLNTARWTGSRDISSSDVTHSVDGPPSGTVKDAADARAAQDDGLAFLAADGAYHWEGHVTGYYRTSKATLGEDTAGGEIPILPGGKPYAFDGTYLYTDVQVANSSVQTYYTIAETTTAAGDPVAQGKRGVRTLPVSTHLQQPEDVYGLAWTLSNRYKDPQLRAGEVTIDCAKQPYAWTFCLSAEVGDLVTVKRRQLNAPVITTLCRILKIKIGIGPNVGQFVFTLGAADAPVITLGGTVTLGAGTIGW